MNIKHLSQMWDWIGWLPLLLLTVLIAIPPGFIWGPGFSQTTGPLASLPDLTWYKTFLWGLDILTPLVTLALLWALERVRGRLPLATKTYWLGMLAAAVIVGCVAACYFVWQWPVVPTLAELDFALTCWLFCGTLKPGFAFLALISGLLIAGVAISFKRELEPERWVTMSLGLATLPIGLLLIASGRRTDGGQ